MVGTTLRTRAGEMTEAICHTSINVVPSGRNLAPLVHAILDFFEDRQLIPILVALGGNFLRKASENGPGESGHHPACQTS